MYVYMLSVRQIKKGKSVVIVISWEINPCIQTHHLLIYQYYKQNILIMHQSNPQDSSSNNQTSLKNAIMRILSSNKKMANQQKENNQSGQIQSFLGEKKYELQLIETIGIYEMKEYPGYISFKEWMHINNKFWGDTIKIWAENLWKIMRFINEGQVIIPTGLVYQIIDCLISQPTQKHLKKVFQSFLSNNSKKKDLSSCRQLKNYVSFSDIINGYTDNITKQEKNQLKEQTNTINLLVERISRVDTQKQRYLMHLRYQSLADQMKQCSFKPKITQYPSQIKKETQEKKQKYDTLFMNQAREKQIIKNFKARPLDSKIFQNPLKPIPGVQKHIHRQQFSQQQRLRLKRFQQRSVTNYN